MASNRHSANKILIKNISKAISEMKDRDPTLPSSAMVPLRELQLILNPLIFSNKDSSERFIAYFLNAFINTVFIDLLGDIPDDFDGVLLEIRTKFLERLVTSLEELLEILQKDENPLPAFERLISSYSDTVNNLNYKDLQLGGPR